MPIGCGHMRPLQLQHQNWHGSLPVKALSTACHITQQSLQHSGVKAEHAAPCLLLDVLAACAYRVRAFFNTYALYVAPAEEFSQPDDEHLPPGLL